MYVFQQQIDRIHCMAALKCVQQSGLLQPSTPLPHFQGFRNMTDSWVQDEGWGSQLLPLFHAWSHPPPQQVFHLSPSVVFVFVPRESNRHRFTSKDKNRNCVCYLWNHFVSSLIRGMWGHIAITALVKKKKVSRTVLFQAVLTDC